MLVCLQCWFSRQFCGPYLADDTNVDFLSSGVWNNDHCRLCYTQGFTRRTGDVLKHKTDSQMNYINITLSNSLYIYMYKLVPEATKKHAQHHDDVINWKPFPRCLSFVRGYPQVSGWFPSQRLVTWSFDLFCWSASEQTVELTIQTPVILNTVALVMTSL